jgi:methionine-rich copper-binding protein CopC
MWAILSVSAQAHAFLMDASPKEGGVIGQAPSEIRLKYSEWTTPGKSTISLFDEPGRPIQTGPVKPNGEDSSILIVDIKAPLTDGVYVVHWTAVGDHNHKTKGDFKFRVGK